MTASTEVLVGDPSGQHVLIRVLSRRFPGLFDSSDGNWLSCEVHVSAGSFRGDFPAGLGAQDFPPFLDEVEALNRSVEGTATFATLEGQIAFTLTGNGQGHVHVEGEALDLPGDNRLRFSFDVDRASLQQICRSLEIVIAAFPVVGSAEA